MTCQECRPGFVCAECVARFPTIYLPPGPERDAAVKRVLERHAADDAAVLAAAEAVVIAQDEFMLVLHERCSDEMLAEYNMRRDKALDALIAAVRARREAKPCQQECSHDVP